MMILFSKIGGDLTEGDAVGLIRQQPWCQEHLHMYHCLFRQADTDNTGVIDKEEFRQLWGAVRCSGGGEVSHIGQKRLGYYESLIKVSLSIYIYNL